ncbi:MAG: 30S ribosomal protein S3 [Parcubacteria group bacterium GW2011_GWC1_35_8]|uniref:Small ribosomal subunit protein uS3 n=3 Tax=Candidatus Nomuraibacteriota TaxID=1752729 RepID=A0A1F6YWG3_9BACT|nr:MAG: 30S ribosomal protein S3 [Parcubacteria group bacterium GW2011_GWC1_35_8]KKP88798.1 MAG: 30S ribosomal protein S3 [Candidatus Nomurabacteria bacterium GW2011_GWC2_35_8]OGJ05746.1 MAG: 30S ribosomal protein S3 [Candidatus Nomurabacteria bacterium RIFOXYA2_FULL_35_9]OGJ06777.1 MAG: 30S ribosomal protein S3 [Candidatus Nomurabacteria bacterium RIFOXYA1_FULL_35_17]OGJ10683.1 MAG: 30S ribosomal protein S3 [Candidatus Nomurabacteria bacterium RIFOXYC2_FULL_36_19]OGJ14861.1 MAG: 30S ribosomal
MSKIVHPYAHRLIILRDWKSRWFADPKKYVSYLKGDVLIRQFLEKKLRGMYVSTIEIERSRKATRFIIKTSRPGLIIGRSGEGATKLKEEILKKMDKLKIPRPEDFKLEVMEISNPEADAAIVAYMIAEGLEKRMPYRRVIKTIIEKVMQARGVEGARVVLSGRLGGADIARTEELKRGSIPLQTFRADIDFKRERATMSYGVIGVKVWIYRGKIFADKKPARSEVAGDKKEVKLD